MGKNRVHVDLRADDLDTEVARLVGHGGRVLHPARDGLVVKADVEDNEFCVTTAEEPNRAQAASSPAATAGAR